MSETPPFEPDRDPPLERFEGVLDAYRREAEAKSDDRRRQRQEIADYIEEDARRVEAYREAMTAEERCEEAAFLRRDEARRAAVAAGRNAYQAELDAALPTGRPVIVPTTARADQPHRLQLDVIQGPPARSS